MLLVLVLVAQACSRGGGPGGPASPEQPPAATSAGDGPVEPAPAVPEARTEVGGGLLDGKIVVLGGLRADGTATDRVDVYDPDQRRWSAGPALPAPLHHMGVASLAGRLFVAGGYTSGPRAGWVETAVVHSLGPGEGQWRPEPALPAPRGALGLGADRNRLVAFGGTSGGAVVATTALLERGAQAWRAGPALSQAREHTAAVSTPERVYAVAGRVGGLDTNLTSVEILDAGAAVWRAGPALNEARGGIAGEAVAGLPCVAGGEAPSGTIASIECLMGDRWQRRATLSTARHGLAAVAVEGRLHVLAGGDRPGLFVTDVHEVFGLG